LDGPPFLASADAQALSSRAEGVLYVLELGRVEREEARRSLELLERANANVLGLALSNAGSSHQNSHAVSNAGNVQRNDSDPFARRLSNSSGRSSDNSLLKKILLGAGALLLALVVWRLAQNRIDGTSLDGGGVRGGSAAAPMTVQDVVGGAQILQGAQWKPLKKGASLPAKSSLKTAVGGALLLKLGNAGVVRVGSLTQLKTNSSAQREYSLQVQQGKVWARFDPGTSEMRFKVRTPAALLSGENATFSVASGLGGALTTVTADEGSLSVRRGDETTEISQGDALRIDRGGRALMVASSQQDAARRMWQLLRDNEGWLETGGAMKLDRAVSQQLATGAKVRR